MAQVSFTPYKGRQPIRAPPKLLNNPYNPPRNVSDESLQRMFSVIQTGNFDDIIQGISETNLNLNIRDKDGNSPLHVLISNSLNDLTEDRKLEIIDKMLINNGVLINAYNNLNITPLHLAAKKQYGKILKYLLDKGADPNALDSQNKNAMHYFAQGLIIECKEKTVVREPLLKKERKIDLDNVENMKDLTNIIIELMNKEPTKNFIDILDDIIDQFDIIFSDEYDSFVDDFKKSVTDILSDVTKTEKEKQDIENKFTRDVFEKMFGLYNEKLKIVKNILVGGEIKMSEILSDDSFSNSQIANIYENSLENIEINYSDTSIRFDRIVDSLYTNLTGIFYYWKDFSCDKINTISGKLKTVYKVFDNYPTKQQIYALLVLDRDIKNQNLNINYDDIIHVKPRSRVDSDVPLSGSKKELKCDGKKLVTEERTPKHNFFVAPIDDSVKEIKINLQNIDIIYNNILKLYSNRTFYNIVDTYIPELIFCILQTDHYLAYLLENIEYTRNKVNTIEKIFLDASDKMKTEQKNINNQKITDLCRNTLNKLDELGDIANDMYAKLLKTYNYSSEILTLIEKFGLFENLSTSLCDKKTNSLYFDGPLYKLSPLPVNLKEYNKLKSKMKYYEILNMFIPQTDGTVTYYHDSSRYEFDLPIREKVPQAGYLLDFGNKLGNYGYKYNSVSPKNKSDVLENFVNKNNIDLYFKFIQHNILASILNKMDKEIEFTPCTNVQVPTKFNIDELSSHLIPTTFPSTSLFSATSAPATTPSVASTGSTTSSVASTGSTTPSIGSTGSTTSSVASTGSTTPSVSSTGSTTPSIGSTGSTTSSVASTGSTTPSIGSTGSTTSSVASIGSTTPSIGSTGSTTPSIGSTGSTTSAKKPMSVSATPFIPSPQPGGALTGYLDNDIQRIKKYLFDNMSKSNITLTDDDKNRAVAKIIAKLTNEILENHLTNSIMDAVNEKLRSMFNDYSIRTYDDYKFKTNYEQKFMNTIEDLINTYLDNPKDVDKLVHYPLDPFNETTPEPKEITVYDRDSVSNVK